MSRKSKHALGRTLPGAAAFLILTGCVTMDPTKVDPTIMRYHNWWNYYVRGQARLEAGDVDGAKTDFENCIGLRKDAKFPFPKEHWRVRTYGMHFLNAYFPNRELGICHYLLKDLESARSYLQESIDQEPSGRAKHYLNEVNMLAMRGERVPGPVIEVEAESLVKVTNARKRVLAGRAAGRGLIRNVQVNGQREFIELAAESRDFEREIALRSGLNRVRIEAVDLKGQRKERVVEWIADWDPPVVTITRAQRIAGGWAIEGLCADALGLGEVTVIEQAVKALPARGKQAQPIKFQIRGGDTVAVRATDVAGNALSASFSEASLGLDEQAWNREDRMLASAADATDAANPILIAAADPAAAQADRLKPSLKISASTRGVSEVFREEFFLSGEARDGGGLVSVSVNGENLLEEAGALQYHFARRLPLDDLGITNEFEVIAVDRAGNTSTKAFQVVRKNPDYLNDEFRLSMGLPPMSAPEEIATDADTVRVELEDALVEWPARFNLVSRDENWESILAEQKLSASALADPRAALELGKIVPAELFLMGKLIKEAGGVTIYASIVDIDKGRVIAAADVYTEAMDDFQERGFYVAGLAMKIEQNFPFVEGIIGEVDGSEVVINVGRKQGVTTGMKFIVLERADEDAPIEDSDVRYFDDKWVQIAVKRAKTSEGTASVLPGEAKGVVQTGDYVASR